MFYILTFSSQQSIGEFENQLELNRKPTLYLLVELVSFNTCCLVIKSNPRDEIEYYR